MVEPAEGSNRRAAKGIRGASERPPVWLVRAMQGLTFLLGYKDALGGPVRFSEGSIADDLLVLLAANCGKHGIGVCREYPVKELGAKNSKERIDLVALGLDELGAAQQQVACVEIKRFGTRTAYEDDLDKLAALRKKTGGVWRAYVLVVSSRKKPTRIVEGEGLAPKGIELWTKAKKTRYAVRRVVRAVDTQDTESKRGYWAVLLEVTG